VYIDVKFSERKNTFVKNNTNFLKSYVKDFFVGTFSNSHKIRKLKGIFMFVVLITRSLLDVRPPHTAIKVCH
jgi:hypothetical protein